MYAPCWDFQRRSSVHPITTWLEPKNFAVKRQPAWPITVCYSQCIQFSIFKSGNLWKCFSRLTHKFQDKSQNS
jgi:hypothetical protein